MTEVYLDNSATTKVCETAVKESIYAMTENYGNPSSVHQKGIDAENIIDESRKVISKILNCESKEIFFTSGGTESNNIAILGAAQARKNLGCRIVTTSIEHSSVLKPMNYLESKGFEVIYLKPDKYGNISKSDLYEAINEKTILVSLMMVNNEIGTITNLSEVKKIIKTKNSPAILHTDAVQAFGKIPINVKKYGIDILSISAHKIHGPKGIGALYISNKVKISPIFFGGGQESNMRPGTEAVSSIAGFKGAVSEMIKDKNANIRISELSRYCKQFLAKNNQIKINSPPNSIANIINISVLRIKSETLTNFLSSHGIYISNGSACSKGKHSHVLKAIGLRNELIDSSIRISLSRYTTKSDIDYFLKYLNEAIHKIVKF